MLNSMRGSGQSKTMWVIMGLLMVGLMGFGAAGLGGGTIRSIGTVGEEPISVNSYVNGYRNASAQLSQQFGRRLTAAELQTLGIQERVLEAVVTQAAINNETTQRGLSVGDDLLRRSILENPQFQGIDGSFDQDAYEIYLDRQLNMTTSEFEALLRKENARAIVQNAVVSGVAGADTVPMALMEYARQERSFEWAALTAENLAEPVPEPTDAQLQAHYDANAANYMSPLTRNITYTWMNPADLLDKVNVDEAQIRESYELQSDRFNKPEQRAVDRVVFPTLEAAQEARDRLDAEAMSFSEVVAERGLTEADVDLGEVERGALSSEAAEVVFAETEPGIVGPVQSALGPALFRINAVITADTTPFEEARAELRDELAGEAARRLVIDNTEEVDDLLAGGLTLEKLAEQTDMKLYTIAYVARMDHPIVAYEEFRTAADAAKVNDYPQVIALSDGGILSLRLDSIDEPAPIPLDEARERLVADWTAAQVQERLLALAEELQPGLEAGGDLADLGLELSPVDGITRTAFIEDLPSRAVQAAFDLENGGVTSLADGDRVVVLRLTNITPFDPDLEGHDAILARIQGQLDSQMAVDILEYYANALQAEAGVSLDRGIINQLNTQVSGY